MAKGQGKTGLIVTIVVLGLTLLTVGSIVIWQNLNRQTTTDTSKQPDTTKDDSASTDTPSTDNSDSTPKPTTPAVDPSTLGSIAIEPLGITVFYTKGLAGFEFAVKRTADSTQYVEFTAPELVSTKCTNDEGLFASIIKNPTSPEDKTIISQTTTVNGVTYGLSLAGKSCASDVSLLEKYQTAFTNGFSQLKGI